ncbi:MAG: hypothetical protein LQ346_008477 [Caloplaca aetnensis]|nr:MAG: hypothetical protein LQ346_008477 [Caloplaca aetnensis]
MDQMASILLEFDSEELAVLSTEGGLGSFRSALADVETIATANIYLPEGHAMQSRLHGLVSRFLNTLANRQTAGSPMLCVDQMRLFTLSDALKDLPQAKEQIKSMLQRQFDNPQSSLAQDAPGCRDPQAHRGLYNTWMELDTNNADNKAVEEVIRNAFLSHSRPRRDATADNGGQGANSVFVCTGDEQEQPQFQPSTFRVETIKVGDETFENAHVTLSHNPAKEILQFHVQEQPSGQGNGTLEVQTAHNYNLKYSTSKKQVALERILHEDNHVLDIHLYSTREGEILVEKLKFFHVIDCPHT